MLNKIFRTEIYQIEEKFRYFPETWQMTFCHLSIETENQESLRPGWEWQSQVKKDAD